MLYGFLSDYKYKIIKDKKEFIPILFGQVLTLLSMDDNEEDYDSYRENTKMCMLYI